MSNLDTKKVKDQREEYLKFWSDINYYVCGFFIIVHPLTMILLYSFWANFHMISLLFSLQAYCLGAFCWAASDEKYEYWIKNKMCFFYFFAISNIIYALMIFIGG